MPFALFANQPMFFLIWILAVLIGLSIHEFSHALAGSLLGDDTAKSMGRLTLNPLSHVDWVGFFMLLFVGFGWGKPVPYNPHNLRFPKWGPALVGMAGPLSNLIGATICGVILKILINTTNLPQDNLLILFLTLLVIINLVLMLFNLIPIPPLDGSKVLLSYLDSPHYAHIRFLLETRGPLILLGVIIADRLLNLNIFSTLFGGIINSVYNLIF